MSFIKCWVDTKPGKTPWMLIYSNTVSVGNKIVTWAKERSASYVICEFHIFGCVILHGTIHSLGRHVCVSWSACTEQFPGLQLWNGLQQRFCGTICIKLSSRFWWNHTENNNITVGMNLYLDVLFILKEKEKKRNCFYGIRKHTQYLPEGPERLFQKYVQNLCSSECVCVSLQKTYLLVTQLNKYFGMWRRKFLVEALFTL